MDLQNLSDRTYDRIFWVSAIVALIGVVLLYTWK
jgi:hypothetical protein